ncbi:arsenate reductase ArsC [Allonocardiopsis opalescens]|uniref:Protein-tyrosine-phosphatase n=1 Tax=Allonocardiopsis opalescens TaxID=1144618 RepID=A0A2T0Q587_9ACTN|nr:arsenate reductase ArsC [Allonocardiopsis opalescens]PRX98942.1 protein-tyrosine-phosphatase [Allonocardiopsis opalescens]
MTAGPLPGLLRPQVVLDRIGDRLADRFRGVFSAATVRRFIDRGYAELAEHASVSTHLTAVTERYVTEQLTAVAQHRGFIAKAAPEVLFVCAHNAGRSQMAAALLRRRLGDRVGIRSAGSRPAAGIKPAVHQAMREIGLDLDDQYPKPLTDDVVRAADIVITLGCGDACPVHPGKLYVDWDVPDPHDRPLAEVRAIRDELSSRVDDLVIDPAASVPGPAGAAPHGALRPHP